MIKCSPVSVSMMACPVEVHVGCRLTVLVLDFPPPTPCLYMYIYIYIETRKHVSSLPLFPSPLGRTIGVYCYTELGGQGYRGRDGGPSAPTKCRVTSCTLTPTAL